MLELLPAKTAEDVVIDYLTCFYEHIMNYLAEETPGPTLEERPIEFWLTTPASWDGETNTKTNRCATLANIGTRVNDNLHITREPDSALLANISNSIHEHEGVYKVHRSDRAPLVLRRCTLLMVAQPGICVSVIDIGGGTIDAQTTTLVNLNPLRTKDAYVGTGNPSTSRLYA